MSGTILRAAEAALAILAAACLCACGARTASPLLGSPYSPPPSAATVFPNGVASTDHPVASQAAAAMLEADGNAVDAAVAASFALSVVRPYSCGIGGGGFMMVHLADDPRTVAPDDPTTVCIVYRERAPAAMGPTWFEDRPDADSTRSGHAVATPGTVAGLLHALEEYGTLDRREVLAPAIAAARDGFEADSSFATALNDLLPEARDEDAHGAAQALRVFRHFAPESRREPLSEVRVGDRLTNPDQARVLEAIAEGGASAFQTGPIAHAIVDSAQGAGGPLALEDLAAYRPVEAEPLSGRFRDWTVMGMPLPSSGGITIIQTLGILSAYDADERARGAAAPLDAKSPTDPVYAHALAESLKHAFANRSRWLADPEFEWVPVDALLDPDWFEEAAARIDPQSTLATPRYGLAEIDGKRPDTDLPVDGGTSHLSVVDRWGNAVACTETNNLAWGSRILADGLGFCLNNEIDDFTTRLDEPNSFGLRQSAANLPAPGKRPLSSMSPTIVLDADGRVVALAGAGGGPRIITGTLQSLLNALHFGDEPWIAVARPRLHHQWLPDELRGEPGYLDAHPQLEHALAARGHALGTLPNVGWVQLLVRVPGGWQAGSDPRVDGAPAGH